MLYAFLWGLMKTGHVNIAQYVSRAGTLILQDNSCHDCLGGLCKNIHSAVLFLCLENLTTVSGSLKQDCGVKDAANGGEWLNTEEQ